MNHWVLMYHYEQNVQQHFYLLDTPVVDVRCISLTLSLKDLRIHGGRGKGEGEGGRGKEEGARGKEQGLEGLSAIYQLSY